MDKPRFLTPLLKRYASFFEQHGLDVSNLQNTHACTEALFQVFTAHAVEVPSELTQELEMLSSLSSPHGKALLLEKAEEKAIAISSCAPSLTTEEWVFALYETYPELVRACARDEAALSSHGFQIFSSQHDTPMTLDGAQRYISALKERLQCAFKRYRFGTSLRLFLHQEHHFLHFQVVYEGRQISGMHSKKNPREMQDLLVYDQILYDMRKGTLWVEAGESEKENLYRSTFSEVLFGEEDFFFESNCLCLHALSKSPQDVCLFSGIRKARLSEVTAEHYFKKKHTSMFHDENLFGAKKIKNILQSRKKSLVRAAIVLEDSHHDPLCHVALHLPDKVRVQSRLPLYLVDTFLKVNHLLIPERETYNGRACAVLGIHGAES